MPHPSRFRRVGLTDPGAGFLHFVRENPFPLRALRHSENTGTEGQYR